MTTRLAHIVSHADSRRHLNDAPRSVPFDWPLRDLSRIVEAAGSRWHVQQTGAGKRLLMIHGTAASTHSWRDLVPLLASDFEIVAMDLPGHGFSDRLPDQSMSLPSLSVATGKLLERLAFEPDYVLGHSAGAAIALRMTLDGLIEPERVVGLNAALLPFGGSLRRIISPMTQLFATTRLMPALLSRRARDVRAVKRVLAGTGSELDDEGVAYYQRLLQRESHIAAVLAMMASWDLEPLIEDFARLRTPLSLIVADGDKAVSPREANRVAKRISDASVVHLGGLGHVAHEEQPHAVAETIRKACTDRRTTHD